MCASFDFLQEQPSAPQAQVVPVIPEKVPQGPFSASCAARAEGAGGFQRQRAIWAEIFPSARFTGGSTATTMHSSASGKSAMTL